MSAFDVAIIRSNSITYDPRVIKIAKSLSKKYAVIVFGWDRELSSKSHEMFNSRLRVKRLKFKAPYACMHATYQQNKILTECPCKN